LSRGCGSGFSGACWMLRQLAVTATRSEPTVIERRAAMANVRITLFKVRRQIAPVRV
jgi:hypothetical protein